MVSGSLRMASLYPQTHPKIFLCIFAQALDFFRTLLYNMDVPIAAVPTLTGVS